MTPPAVSASPPSRPSTGPASAAAPELRVRAPFSRPRKARPPLLTPRTAALSLALHVVLLLAVLLAPKPERRVAPAGEAASASTEAVEYLDVGAWGGLATEAAGGPRALAAAPPPAVSAAAVDSLLRNLPQDVVFPDRVPPALPRASGAGAAPVPAAAARPGAVQGGAPGGVQGGAPAGVPGGRGAAAGGAGRGRSGPGGLGPELGDPRLVVTPTAVPERVLEDEERYQAHFAARIRALNDSMANATEAERRSREWTITDRNGKKWGLTDRGWVVNGRALPGVPVPNPIPRSARDREDEARRERDQRRDIDRQAEQIERERYLQERGRAIRKRNDRERQQGAGGDGSP